jgi:hypothetical protein
MAYETGLYLVKVLSQEFGTNKAGDTKQFRLRVVVLGRLVKNDAEDFEPCEEANRTIYFTFSQEYGHISVEQLQHIGWEGPNFATLVPTNENCHDFTGFEFPAWCKATETGESWNVSMPRKEAEPVDPAGLRQLDAMFGSMLKKKAKPAAARTTKPAPARASVPLTDPNLDLAAAAAEASEGDIPF